MADRALVFIDGNNWYHSLKDAGVQGQGALDYPRISTKLAGPRTWVGTRYYIGQVSQTGNMQLYADQRRFLARLQQQDARISVHLSASHGAQLASSVNAFIHIDAPWLATCFRTP